MGIQIIEKDERLKGVVSGVTFEYRRMTSTEQAVIERNHTHKGRTDWRGVTEEVMKRCLLDWDEQMVDGRGDPLSFDKKYIPFIPEENRAELAELFYAGNPEDAQLKNSGSGSRDSTSIAD